MKKEIWKECKYRKKNKLLIFEKYLISDLGRLKNKLDNTILEYYTNNKGYNEILLLYKNESINIRIDKLVLFSHMRHLICKKKVRHINNKKHDNRLKNLLWKSKGRYRISDIKVKAICDLLQKGYNSLDIIKKLNIQCDKTTISSIRNKKIYRHISKDYEW